MRAGRGPARRLGSAVRGGRARCGLAGSPGLAVRAGGGPAGRLRSALLGRYGRARPRGASRRGLSGCGLPVLPAAHAVRTTGPGLSTAGPRRPAGTWLGAARRPVRAGAWRGPRAIRRLATGRLATGRLATARRWAATEPRTAGSRAAVARRGVGRPVRRAVAAPARLIRTPPRGLVRAAIGTAPRGLIGARNRRRTVPWCLLAGRLRRNRAVSQVGAGTAARGPAVLQIRRAHPASVFLLRAPHGAVRYFSCHTRLVTRSRDGCPHLGCSPGYPHESRAAAPRPRPAPTPARRATPAPGPTPAPPRTHLAPAPAGPMACPGPVGQPRAAVTHEAQAGHMAAYRMLRFAVPGAGRYPYLTSMSISMPRVPRLV